MSAGGSLGMSRGLLRNAVVEIRHFPVGGGRVP